MWLKFVVSRGAARILMVGLAGFAMVWAIARACAQAVTGDEAQAYLFHAATSSPTHWDSVAANHMLNSLLERLFTSVFGLSAFAVRLPSLIGAALYIYAIYQLCQMISAEWKVRIPLFICLVYNPFIFDFFVAARGYGLANAFLVTAIAVSAYWHLRGGELRDLIVANSISSFCLGLAFTANFSLAFAGVTTGALLLAWAIKREPRAWWKLVAAAVIPGLLVVVTIPSWTILNWPDGQIVAGVKTLRETLDSLVNATMYEPNPYLINPLLMPLFETLREILLPLVGFLALVQLGWILWDRVWRRSTREGPEWNSHTAWLCMLGSVISGIALLAVAEHRLAYRLFHLLMPVSRTGLFFLPLVTAMVGVAAAIPPLSRGAAASRIAFITALGVLSVYYLSCMRLMYFEEWQYQADLKDAYKVLACYNHEKNIQDVEVSWYYHAGMNFQRVLSGRETFPPFASTTPHTTGHQMYVLHQDNERDFINALGLKVVFKGSRTAMVIAAPPEVADSRTGACYVWPLLFRDY